MHIKVAQTNDEILACFPVLVQLRPKLREAELVARVRRQEADGYRLAYLGIDGKVVTVAGYRVNEKLAWGRVLHVDDLVTDEAARSHGNGARVIEWLRSEAARLRCDSLQLDCGLQRTSSHRFYEREGLKIVAYHFEEPIAPGSGVGR